MSRNRLIEIKTAARTPDTIGGRTTALTSAVKIWAKIRPMTGKRLVEFGQATNMKGYEIDIPFYSEVTIDETVQIIYDSRTLNVHSVIDNMEGRSIKTIIAFEKK